MAVSIDAVAGQRENEGLIGDNDPGASMGGGPQEGLIGGSGYQQMDEFAEDSPTAPDTTGMPDDPTFSGSNAIIDVDTFEDIRAAQMARDVRTMSNAWDAHKTGGYAGYAVYKENDPNTATTSGSYSPAGAKRGSVNLAPRGINVGYRSKIGKIDTLELDETTKSAIKAAGIQSQAEDETENAIAQIYSAFQSIMSKANKNTMNRSEGSGGYGNTEPGDK